MGSNTKTPKARALGAALREARERKGISLRGLAEQLGRDPSVLSRWETGERSPKEADVAQILTMLGINGQAFEETLELTHDPEAPNWLAVSLPEQRQHLAALLRFERDASRITAVSPLIVTGLLQTPAYVRAIMTGGGVPDDEIDTRIAVRLGRREILKKVEVTALIGEAALRQEVGGRSVLIEQLRHLVDMSGQVDVRVIPFRAGWHPALEGAWTVIESLDAPPVIQLENRRSGLILHQEQDVEAYRKAVEAAMEAAMSPQESVGLIAEVINELERWE